MKKYFIILGPPGSGKGTQAKKLAQKLSYIHFGTGDLMRKEAEKGTPLGLQFKKVWKKGKGELVSEDLVQKFVAQKIHELDISKGVVFDGYPRTVSQANHLFRILKEKSIDNLVVFNLVVNTDELIKRLETRRVCQGCKRVFQDPDSLGITDCNDCEGKLIQREEDKSEVIRRRIEIYNKQTAPLIDFYQKTNNLIEINGNPPIKEVWAEIQEKI